MKTIKQIKIEIITELNKYCIEDSTSIANLILQKEFNCTKEYLIINSNMQIDEIKEKNINNNISLIISGIPVEYIVNKKSFMNCEIYVDKNVLIPRQDTEVLVENIIETLKNCNNEKINILELCTGSGCISVGLLTYLRDKGYIEIYNKINILAIDISSDALNVARINVEKYNLLDKITLLKSNLFDNIHENKFDIIVSNPPYIKKEDIDNLDVKVKNEPILALDGGIDGLYFYREISNKAKKYLNNNGYILYEIGYDQADDVSNILKYEEYTNIKIVKDLSGNNRVVICKI